MSILLVVGLTVTSAIFLVAGLGAVAFERLVDMPARTTDGPLVSVVLAARDEASHLQVTIDALLSQRYSPLEILIVDDRSTDGTGAIAERAAAADSRVSALHLTVLPDGWLGKNHALQAGAARARGEFLLFTDGDVRLAPDAVGRAADFMVGRQVDHLAVIPGITSPSRAVRWYVGAFSIFFLLYTRAWQAPNRRRRASIGIGAFNMVRAGRYRDLGGHEPIRMRPDDDLMLGRILKRSGGRAGVLVGPGEVDVDWYASLGELVRGVEKNTFAGLGYSLTAACVSFAVLLLHALYFLLPLVTTGALRLAVLGELTVLVLAGAAGAITVGQPVWCALLQPVAAVLFAWIQARATYLTLSRGGIRWRGTFYPLADLRRNRV